MLERDHDDALVLLRFAGELFIKSRRTRSAFLRRLRHNLEDALESVPGQASLEGGWDRLYVRAGDESALDVLARVFGLSSLSPIDRVTAAVPEDIVTAGAETFLERVRGRTFAVRARRAGSHPFSSKDIEVELGARLLDASAGVDLDDPEVEVFVEVRNDRAWLFGERVDGAGGLPLGVEGRAVTLLSGGYDSAVAAWLMLKRGIAQDYVFCNLGGDAYERAVVQVGKVLADEWSYGTRPRLHSIDFSAPLAGIREGTREKYWQVVLKRLMYRAASLVGAEVGAQAVITGEAVGQVSSQTLANLAAIEPAADLPVFRPLLGFDKEEIIARARRVGTAGLSEQVKEYCAIAPGRPVTSASVEAVAAEEAKVDPTVVERAVAARRVLELRSLTSTDLVAPYLFTEDVPAGSRVLDCRPVEPFRHWHLPDAERWDEWELLRRFRKLDRDEHYVLYCGHGIQSAHIAEKMQRAGYEAYSFRGGVRALREWAAARGITS
ncbi:MAG: tRNA 4-thiouridine(8) synthase ThiI [Gemmatimonadetes bacterium]|nr:tRNA 4-thiouridine(8) synthase ThiI [Gemmatimonadota bacterium]NIQ60221.1 tRNA 4-thiouridine(8) synthase ThiI [Gemmatimonadota bacterium]NIU80436.1 tRNA 4-thiouridine(8) synthase ThiI [Gammaproteobacteria bacterium]NIX48773.1 tRNA 4-thiouridine(8) synthase ThiI [Gemmatimonadota bacterium]NIY13229.1 tRNA 4-thiouridine(8) synthase ThiI [Gemmatimonadota bacterium]